MHQQYNQPIMEPSLSVNFAPEPDYPRRDISPEAADRLSLMLQNEVLIDQIHTSAEQAVESYARSHRALRLLAGRFDNPDVAHGVDLGATVYEATATLVTPGQRPTHSPYQFSLYRSYIINGGVAPTATLFEAAGERLTADCPNLCDVVREVAARRSPRLAQTALMGAALSRQIELDIADTAA